MNTETKKFVFSVDAENLSLRGKAFAIAATLTNPDGVEVASFSARINAPNAVEWVRMNVVPHIQDIRLIEDKPMIPRDVAETETQFRQGIIPAYQILMEEFATFFKANCLVKGDWGMTQREDLVIIAHCPTPVESNLFQELYNLGLIGEFEGGYLLGIEGLLDAKGEKPNEATSYATKHGLELPKGSPHNPLYDCRLATAMYRHLKGYGTTTYGTVPADAPVAKQWSSNGPYPTV